MTQAKGSFIEKGIGRLLSRLQQEFLPSQTLNDIVGQAEQLRGMTEILLNLSRQYPERASTVLNVLFGLVDLGVIHDMNSASGEITRLAQKMTTVLPAEQGGVDDAFAGFAALATGQHSKVAGVGSHFVQGMSPEVKEKPGQWIANRDEPYCSPQESVFHDEIICLHCGGAFSMLKRHIERQHRQSPEGYRVYWGLAPDYPMACESYSTMKKLEASRTGLGHYDRKKKGPSRIKA
ncbi:MucR family transcriptional regulator [Bombella saccharophila]|uniref:MucR family transcriptional regulator n=1 Tax=Bombella saccharophila TaxID=2967338 RepID=A0ABT3W7A2_9PROT|nr:MucR family transcriptional regulator [Bombella saccharophila]MCX5614961.1 MucR family transcriptional regulator [Bombella saccharophila]